MTSARGRAFGIGPAFFARIPAGTLSAFLRVEMPPAPAAQ
jgi:hypothetical protein